MTKIVSGTRGKQSKLISRAQQRYSGVNDKNVLFDNIQDDTSRCSVVKSTSSPVPVTLPWRTGRAVGTGCIENLHKKDTSGSQRKCGGEKKVGSSLAAKLSTTKVESTEAAASAGHGHDPCCKPSGKENTVLIG